jgi:hypothetical protein
MDKIDIDNDNSKSNNLKLCSPRNSGICLVDFFSPTNRLEEALGLVGGGLFTEVSLAHGTTMYDLYDRGGWTSNDILTVISHGNTVMWIGPETFLASRYFEQAWVGLERDGRRQNNNEEYACYFFLDISGMSNNSNNNVGIYSSSPVCAARAMNDMVRIMAYSASSKNCHFDEVRWGCPHDNTTVFPVESADLEQFLLLHQQYRQETWQKHSQQPSFISNRLCFQSLTLRPEHCRALLGAANADTLCLRFENCRFADQGRAFVQALMDGSGDGGQNCCRFPIKLSFWDSIGMSDEHLRSFFATLQSSKTRIESLELINNRLDDSQMAALVRALTTNQSLVELRIFSQGMSDENWTALCASLRQHPTLRVLDLRYSFPFPQSVSVERKLLRTRAILSMFVPENHSNTVLQDIKLLPGERDETLFPALLSHLRINRWRPRVLALQRMKVQTAMKHNGHDKDDHAAAAAAACRARPALCALALLAVQSRPEIVHFLLVQTLDTLLPFLSSRSSSSY